MVDQKELLMKAVVTQIKNDLASGNEQAIYELVEFLNEDVMIGFIDEDIVEAIFPG